MPVLKSVVQMVLFCIIDPIAQYVNEHSSQSRHRHYGCYLG